MNTPTPTPETDALKWHYREFEPFTNTPIFDLAEKIERKLTAAREELKETKKHLKDANRGAEINAHALRINADKLIAVTEQLKETREELETERIRLAACGVVAMADTKKTRTKAREMLPEYRSASLSDVERRVDECIKLREQRDRLAEALKEIEWSNDSQWQADRASVALQSLNQNK